MLMVALLGSTLSAASWAAGAVPPRVATCDGLFVRGGQPWVMKVGSMYAGLDDPVGALARLRALGLNTVRITDFLDQDHGDPATAPYDEAMWRRVDQVIAAARRSGMSVLLDLSTYRNLLVRAGRDAYRTDWSPFLDFVVNRQNTATGVRYGADPTIALVAFAGEPAAITGRDNTFGLTTDELTDFYRRVEQYWHDRAPGQLLTTGGFLFLDWNSGIDLPGIMNLPHNDVFTIHVYSEGDLRQTIPAVSAEARRSGRAWMVEEWGQNSNVGDEARADRFRTVVLAARSHRSAGFGFWNVGTGTADTFDLGPQFPQVFKAITAWTSSARLGRCPW